MFFNPGASSQGAARGGAASGNDAATTAWVAAVVGAGGTVSGTQTTRVNTLIVALKAHGLFTILDRLYLFAGESVAQQAAYDIISATAGTVVPNGGTLTLAAGGYTSATGIAYFTSGFIPSTAGGHYALNSAHLGAYVRSSRTTDQTAWAAMGTVVAGVYSYFKAKTGGTFEYDINGSTFYSFTNANAQGSWTVTRTGVNAVAVYKNGSSVNTGAGSSVSLANVAMVVFGNNAAGSVSQITNDQQAAAWFGGALDATQASNLATDINAYMTAWGVNVY